MKDTKIIKELKERFPATDIWLDSMIEEDVEYALRNGFLGTTTSPTITPKAIEAEMDLWKDYMNIVYRNNPTINERELLWEAMYHFSRKRSEIWKPIFKKGEFSGHFCIQANVYDFNNAERIIEQARRIHGLNENFMIKIPVTEGGVKAIEQIIYEGHSVMSTGSGSVAQIKAACEAMYRGLARREAEGLDNSAIVLAAAFQLGLPEQCYNVYVKENNIDITSEALEYAGVAVVKKAYNMIQEKYPKVNLVLSNFVTEKHLTELMGGKVMLTISPKHIDDLESYTITNKIDTPVKKEYIDELLEKIPFYKKAYQEDGMKIEEFIEFEGFIRTLNHFMNKYDGAIRVARSVIIPDDYDRTGTASNY